MLLGMGVFRPTALMAEKGERMGWRNCSVAIGHERPPTGLFGHPHCLFLVRNSNWGRLISLIHVVHARAGAEWLASARGAMVQSRTVRIFLRNRNKRNIFRSTHRSCGWASTHSRLDSAQEGSLKLELDGVVLSQVAARPCGPSCIQADGGSLPQTLDTFASKQRLGHMRTCSCLPLVPVGEES